MQLIEILAIKEKIKSKIDRGDFVRLSKILEVSPTTARARYRRNNKNAVLIMLRIIEEEQKLITKIKKYAFNL